MKSNHIRSNIVTVIFSLLFVALLSTNALAFDAKKDITNQQAYDSMQKGELILVDVRTEGEWKQSGVAQNALTISMQDPKLIEKIAKIRQDNPNKAIAFICASGVRSSAVQREFVKRGYENVWSVYGGTTGDGVRGWIKDGFPVVKYKK